MGICPHLVTIIPYYSIKIPWLNAHLPYIAPLPIRDFQVDSSWLLDPLNISLIRGYHTTLDQISSGTLYSFHTRYVYMWKQNKFASYVLVIFVYTHLYGHFLLIYSQKYVYSFFFSPQRRHLVPVYLIAVFCPRFWHSFFCINFFIKARVFASMYELLQVILGCLNAAK